MRSSPIGGNVDVRGRVEDDVVAVLGNVRLGPHAVVTGVGDERWRAHRTGARRRGARRGERGDAQSRAVALRRGGHWRPWMGRDMFSGWFSLLGTLLRIALVTLLALIVAIVAVRPRRAHLAPRGRATRG